MYAAGIKIEARFGGKSRYFPGKLVKKNDDGTWEIRYDDGDSEKSVNEYLIRVAQVVAGSTSDVSRSCSPGTPLEVVVGDAAANEDIVGDGEPRTPAVVMTVSPEYEICESEGNMGKAPTVLTPEERAALRLKNRALYAAVASGSLQGASEAVDNGADVNALHGVIRLIFLSLSGPMSAQGLLYV